MNTRTTRPSFSRRLSLESLEDRALMAVLTIAGTGNADNVLIQDASPTQWRITRNGQVSIHAKAGVTQIRFNGGNGNDTFDDRSSGTVPALVYGGNGNDVIRGGNGADSLLGNAGNDRIFGRGGNDYLHGGDGDDELYGHAGNDWIVGGNQNDRLSGDAGNDHLLGLAGVDRFFAADGGNIFDAVLAEQGEQIQRDPVNRTLFVMNQWDDHTNKGRIQGSTVNMQSVHYPGLEDRIIFRLTINGRGYGEYQASSLVDVYVPDVSHLTMDAALRQKFAAARNLRVFVRG